jgi:hypothetical protein
MAIKAFRLDPCQRLLVDFSHSHERAVVEVDGCGRIGIWNDKCRHRGGPLHLCYRDGSGTLRCPWHDRPAGQRVASQLLAAVFLKSSRTIMLINDEAPAAPWPVRYLCPFAKPDDGDQRRV